MSGHSRDSRCSIVWRVDNFSSISLRELSDERGVVLLRENWTEREITSGNVAEEGNNCEKVSKDCSVSLSSRALLCASAIVSYV